MIKKGQINSKILLDIAKLIIGAYIIYLLLKALGIIV